MEEFSSVQFSWVTQSCPTLCDPMNRSMPGLPAHHHLPEFAQTHVQWVSDAIQPSHSLLSPSPPAFSLSQHQGPCQCPSHQVAPSFWHPPWLNKACTTRKDSESEWLAKDNPETNPITIKPETARHIAKLISWVPLATALHPGALFQ